MQNKLPVDTGWMGDPKRGASLGRASSPAKDKTVARKFTLQHIRINSGGYDSGGAYWGIGARLYWAHSEPPEGWIGPNAIVEHFIRAHNRTHAKATIRVLYPNAKFFGGG